MDEAKQHQSGDANQVWVGTVSVQYICQHQPPPPLELRRMMPSNIRVATLPMRKTTPVYLYTDRQIAVLTGLRIGSSTWLYGKSCPPEYRLFSTALKVCSILFVLLLIFWSIFRFNGLFDEGVGVYILERDLPLN
jgi:hypothetical protein